MKHRLFSAVAAAVVAISLSAVALAQKGIDEKRVRAHMEFLASDEMQGRGSGTKYEKLAGLYLASQMREYGIVPAGDKGAEGLGAYIQTIKIERTSLTGMSADVGGKKVALSPIRIAKTGFTGTLQRVNEPGKAKKGSIALLAAPEGGMSRQVFGQIFSSPAEAVVVIAGPQMMKAFEGFARRGSNVTTVQGIESRGFTSLIFVGTEESKAFAGVEDGTTITIEGVTGETQTSYTWNAVGKIEGSSDEAILLSAHMDHVGTRENAPGDDKIFNGADDDASGCVAVIELARVLASGETPKRTVFFAFYGSEEAGGFGSRFFVNNLPLPMEKLVANLQFEMLGRPDAKVGKDELWLTGFERSTLGPKLAENGAKLVPDPHPEQNFFERSDNISLARRGIVAHTVSSYGLHKDYHRVTDEIDTIDFAHLTKSVAAMVEPIKWLANTTWQPSWNAGMKP